MSGFKSLKQRAASLNNLRRASMSRRVNKGLHRLKRQAKPRGWGK